MEFNRIWRYSNGNSTGSALNFGTIEAGETYSHINSNRKAPAGAASYTGYSDFWLNDSPDVVYKFTITGNSKKVTISTDNSTTNYDSKIDYH